MQVPQSYVDQFAFVDNPYRKVYHAMVKHLDDDVGTVVDELKRKGMWNNTLLVMSSDVRSTSPGVPIRTPLPHTHMFYIVDRLAPPHTGVGLGLTRSCASNGVAFVFSCRTAARFMQTARAGPTTGRSGVESPCITMSPLPMLPAFCALRFKLLRPSAARCAVHLFAHCDHPAWCCVPVGGLIPNLRPSLQDDEL